jgi:hypothetical protein
MPTRTDTPALADVVVATAANAMPPAKASDFNAVFPKPASDSNFVIPRAPQTPTRNMTVGG